MTLPGDPAIYFIKSTSNASGAQALYTRAPQTGVLKQTSKQVLPDGHGGWKLDGGLPGGGQGSSRAAMSNPATRRPLLSEEQKQEAIARANSAYKTAQNELGDAKKRLNDAEQDLKMIERTHGPSGDLWSAVRPPSPGPLHHPSPQEYALHELRRPGYPIEWAALRELQIPNDPNWVTSFKPGKERAQAEDAVAKAQRQVEAAQKKVDDADQSLQEAMHAPSVAVRSSGEESVERSEK
ncbi:hypothetical protein ISP19_08110 [Dyella flava]|uniref:Uncharacterized protein n=1 Tax=Dyella flava TaxID=1920170 RepID=A0ABS2K2U6_9GAMM|nr:hypothetical protein [Dyella flava]